MVYHILYRTICKQFHDVQICLPCNSQHDRNVIIFDQLQWRLYVDCIVVMSWVVIYFRHYKLAYSDVLELRMLDTNLLEVKTIAGFVNYKVFCFTNNASVVLLLILKSML